MTTTCRVGLRERLSAGVRVRSCVAAAKLVSVAAVAACGALATTAAAGPTLPFTVSLIESSCRDAPPLQAFAVGVTSDGRWLCIGGRTTGLHGRNDSEAPEGPAANFMLLNEEVWVIDPAPAPPVSRSLLDLLPLHTDPRVPSLAESLAVSNPQFHQIGNELFIVGGYGRLSDPALPGVRSNVTFATVTIIDVDEVAEHVIQGTTAEANIRRSAPHERLRVTGGELVHAGSTFYLVFGQNFAGDYTPQANGEYTYEVRPFSVDGGVDPPLVTHGTSGGSPATASFRRRDLNVAPAHNAAGDTHFVAFGGVFTKKSGVWHQPVRIVPDGPNVTLTEDATFEQQMCQYDCAVLPIWSGAASSMYTVFFGGISEVFYDAAQGVFHRNNAVPFIRQVACIRDDGTAFSEFLVMDGGTGVPLEFPQLLGANARFIAEPGFLGPDGILDLDALMPLGPVKVGSIYGGILAAQPNGNFGTSEASSLIFDVYLSPLPAPTIPVVLAD